MTRAKTPSRHPPSPKGRLSPKLSPSGTVIWKGFEEDPEPEEFSAESEEEDDSTELVSPDQVMPHGKSAKDICLVCFQIPSSNNVCGC